METPKHVKPKNRPNNDDLGLELINNAHDAMQIDARWTSWEPRGFTWWGWHHAQTIWSEPPILDGEFQLYRLHARTDVFDGFERKPEQLAVLDMLGACCTLSGIIRAPGLPSRLQLACSAYVHSGNADWVRRLFVIALCMQVAEAGILSKGHLPKKFGFKSAISAHPQSGHRSQMDEMLDVFRTMVAPIGHAPSSYAGAEMEELLEFLRRPPCIMATGDPNGVVAEYPYPTHSSLLKMNTKEKHMRAGNGLLTLLHLPDGNDDALTKQQALELNEKELTSTTRAHFFGSWCASKQGLTFASFYPNCIHVPGAMTNIALDQVSRAGWYTNEVLGYSWERNFEKDFRAKLAQIERLTAGGSRKSLLAKLFSGQGT